MSEPAGIIYPPPDLRGMVDSTAKYVAKNGGAFEERIKREHRDKPKFSFLLSSDPFNAYYQFKVKEIRNQLAQELLEKNQPVPLENQDGGVSREGFQRADSIHQHSSPPPQSTNGDQQLRTDDFSEKHDNQQTLHNEPDQEHSQDDDSGVGGDGVPRVRLKLNEYIQDMTMKLEKPPALNYLAAPAPTLKHMDSDIIKLTAQFVATHGRAFLLELVSREQNSSQFDFLKPQHGQFNYLANLIMQYALIQNQPLDILEQLDKDATSQKHVLDRMKMRAEWTRKLEIERKQEEEAQEKERSLYSQIDWHDFVIVETIDYHPDERGEYPPTTADQVGTRLLLQQRYEEQSVPEEMEIDMDMDSDSEETELDSEKTSKNDFTVPDLPDLLPPRPDKVVIRRDYDPKTASKSTSQQPDNYFVSPITNERIPVDKIHEHVRYNLSDPKYLEKKDQMLQERINEESVFASGSQIQSSLKNLAERRTDIFGLNDKETAIGRRIGEEEQAEPAKDDRLIWDGHKSSLKKKKFA